jgi:predicted site-specific integrase-resolvase
MLRERFPNHELIQDIGSGINFKRKGIGKLLDIAIKGELEEVVVAYKDRLCRIGYELFEQLFTKLSNAKILVLNQSSCSPDEELAEDILTVVTVFSATVNGRKRYRTRKINNDENKNFPEGETPT